MAPKRKPTHAEYQQVLDENDALRAKIVRLKDKLENCENDPEGSGQLPTLPPSKSNLRTVAISRVQKK
jgi:hypothetical protein